MPRLITYTPQNQDATPSGLTAATGAIGGYLEQARAIRERRKADAQVDVENRYREEELRYRGLALKQAADSLGVRNREADLAVRQLEVETERRKMLLEQERRAQSDRQALGAIEMKRLHAMGERAGSIPRTYSQLGLLPGVDYPDPVSPEDEADIASISDPGLRAQAIEHVLSVQEAAALDAEKAGVAEMIQRYVEAEGDGAQQAGMEGAPPSGLYTSEEAQQLIDAMESGQLTPFQVFQQHRQNVEHEVQALTREALRADRQAKVGEMLGGEIFANAEGDTRERVFELVTRMQMPGEDEEGAFDELQAVLDPPAYQSRMNSRKARAYDELQRRQEEEQAQREAQQQSDPVFQRQIDPNTGRVQETGTRAKRTLEKRARPFAEAPLDDAQMDQIAARALSASSQEEAAAIVEQMALERGVKFDHDFVDAYEAALERPKPVGTLQKWMERSGPAGAILSIPYHVRENR